MAAQDPQYDYYLMKVTSNGTETLKNDTVDDNIVQGHFFLRENLIDMIYKLDTKRKAIVLAATNRYICPDIISREKKKPTYKVPLTEHEEINASL